MDIVLRGGERVKLRELSRPGISSTQTVAYIPAVNSLLVGDMVHHKAHAWLEGGIVNGKPTPTMQEWIAGLQELKSVYPADAPIYGGRGITVDLETSVAEQIVYLKRAQSLVETKLRTLGTNAQQFLGADPAPLYKELAAKFQATFPDYALTYMIEYGAYGLVQDELQKLNVSK